MCVWCQMVIVSTFKVQSTRKHSASQYTYKLYILPIDITYDHFRPDHDQMIDTAYAKLAREPEVTNISLIIGACFCFY